MSVVNQDTTDLEKEWIDSFDIETGRLKRNLSNECYEWAKSNSDKTSELEDLQIGKLFDKYAKDIKILLKKYIDLEEKYYLIITLWILGTYVHKEFQNFPLLFINATKGSGKTRLLKLISALSRNGKIVLDLKEAVLFRTAKDHTICIDEFEGVGSKESNTIRTMINAAYKKGVAVERMKKVSIKGQEQQVVERFDLYTPMAMANIWGVEEVLSDRCIQVILEKSTLREKVKLLEDYEQNPLILDLKSSLNSNQCTLCMYLSKKNVIKGWNEYIENHNISTLNTYIHINTLSTPIKEEDFLFFKRVDESNIEGRNLELFFPLIIIARAIGEETLSEVLNTIKEIVKEKKEEEYSESRDITLIDFISKRDDIRGSFKSVHDLTNEFKLVATQDPDQEKWINPHWIGRALKRNKLIIQKRRRSQGKEVMLDIDKAKILLSRFKEVIKDE